MLRLYITEVSFNLLRRNFRKLQHTWIFWGNGRLLENFPRLRSLTTNPLSSLSAAKLVSPEMMSRFLCTSIETSSLRKPGNSKVAVMTFVSVFSCMSILDEAHFVSFRCNTYHGLDSLWLETADIGASPFVAILALYLTFASALSCVLSCTTPNAMVKCMNCVVHHAAHLRDRIEGFVDEGVERHRRIV